MEVLINDFKEYGEFFENSYGHAAKRINQQISPQELSKYRIRILPQSHPRRTKPFAHFQEVSYSLADAAITSFLVFIGKFQVEIVVLSGNWFLNQGIQKKIGAGGYGEIYERELNGKVYVEKSIKARKRNEFVSNILQLDISRRDLMYVVTEVAILKLLSLFNIAPALPIENSIDIVCGNDCVSFFMEKCDELNIPDTNSFTDFYLQMKANVLAMHTLGIVHKDIKPANIMQVGKKYFLIDFGISSFAQDGPSALHSTFYEGTPFYMSGDMYSIGHKQNPHQKSSINIHYNDYHGLRKTFLQIKKALPYHRIQNKKSSQQSKNAIVMSQQMLIESNNSSKFQCFSDNICVFAFVLGEFLFKSEVSQQSKCYLYSMNDQQKQVIASLLLKTRVPDQNLLLKLQILQDHNSNINLRKIFNSVPNKDEIHMILTNHIKVYGYNSTTLNKFKSIKNKPKEYDALENIFMQYKQNADKNLEFKLVELGSINRLRSSVHYKLNKKKVGQKQLSDDELFNLYFILIKMEDNEQSAKVIFNRLKNFEDLELSKTESLLMNLLQNYFQSNNSQICEIYEDYAKIEKKTLRKQQVFLLVAEFLIKHRFMEIFTSFSQKFKEFHTDQTLAEPLRGRWQFLHGVYYFISEQKQQALASFNNSKNIFIDYHGKNHPNLIPVYQWMAQTLKSGTSRLQCYERWLSLLIKYDYSENQQKTIEAYCTIMNEYLGNQKLARKELLEIICQRILFIQKKSTLYFLQINPLNEDESCIRRLPTLICETLTRYYFWTKKYNQGQKWLVNLILLCANKIDIRPSQQSFTIKYLYENILGDNINSIIEFDPSLHGYLIEICQYLITQQDSINQKGHLHWLGWVYFFLNDPKCLKYCTQALQISDFDFYRKLVVKKRFSYQRERSILYTISNYERTSTYTQPVNYSSIESVMLKYKASVYHYAFSQIQTASTFAKQAVEQINWQISDYHDRLPLLQYQYALCLFAKKDFKLSMIHILRSRYWAKEMQSKQQTDEHFSEKAKELLQAILKKRPIYSVLLDKTVAIQNAQQRTELIQILKKVQSGSPPTYAKNIFNRMEHLQAKTIQIVKNQLQE